MTFNISDNQYSRLSSDIFIKSSHQYSVQCVESKNEKNMFTDARRCYETAFTGQSSEITTNVNFA